MQRLFLDANVLFSAAYREAAPLQRLWGMPGVELITSGYAVGEAERHLDAEQRMRLRELLKPITVVPEPASAELPAGVRLRAKDAPILAAAISHRATHIITGDRRDFGAYFGRRIGGVLVVPPRDYFALQRRPRRRRR